jgi:hypothetical protein
MKLFVLLFLASPAFTAETRDVVFAKSIEAMFPKLVEIRRDIHMHPELPNEEVRTAKLVADRLKELGFTDIKTGVAKHGVVACSKAGRTVPAWQCGRTWMRCRSKNCAACLIARRIRRDACLRT